MKILLVLKQKKNVETFAATIRALTDRGHSVALAVQEHSDTRADQYRGWIDQPASPKPPAEGGRFSLVRCPAHRTDRWSDVAWLLRSLRDCVHYQQPAMRNATKLQARSVQKLREELRIDADNEAVAHALRGLPGPQIGRLEDVFALAERQLPVDPVYESFVREHAPDVLLISPLVHFGSAQADFVAGARAAGVPVGMLLYSWDNLSTKGCLHRLPDWMFVWNERQRTEARALHEFPEDRVFITGAPRFDSFFELGARLTRDEFHAPLGLDPAKPTLLYVCSSLLVSAGELAFVQAWLAAIRASSGSLRDCNILVRPHPDIELLGDGYPSAEVHWPSVRGAKGFVSRPFDDPRAIVLKTADRARQGFFECLFHSAAVVGLNTSAELEAAIVGRPVYTVIAGSEAADGQNSTLHFHYLLEEQGGCVRRANDLTEHVSQLQGEIDRPRDRAEIRRFAGEFLRPHGIDRPVAPVLADAIERAMASGARPQAEAARVVVEDGPEAEPAAAAAGTNDGPIVPLTHPKYEYALRVHTSPRAHRDSYRLDKGALQWLWRDLAIGDVVYDVDCGDGAYAMLAAKYHGAVVIAFEPGYAAFKALCENLHLNGCDGSVMPVSLALADFEGMGELKYPAGQAGWRGHSIKPAQWKVKRSSGGEGSIRQPAYVLPLDQTISRYGLPAPHHLHLHNAHSVERVLAGATGILASDRLKTIVFTLTANESEILAARLATQRWYITRQTPMTRGRAHVVLSKTPRATPPVAASR
jgi:FkbM family methyltransferase